MVLFTFRWEAHSRLEKSPQLQPAFALETGTQVELLGG